MTSVPADPPIVLVSSGHAHPDVVLTSDELAALVPDLEVGWAQKHLGVEERRIASPEEHISTFAIAATHQALRGTGWADTNLDAIICGTSFVDDLLPATASLVAQQVAPGAVAFDLNAACASGPYALVVAQSLMRSDPNMGRVAVCVAERPTAWANYETRDSCVFWGDAAACVLLERGATSGLVLRATSLRNEAEFAERVRVPRAGCFAHDGRYSRTRVVSLTRATCAEVLEDIGAKASDVRAFVGHQSNIPLLQEIGASMSIPWERQWHNVEWAGNQGGSGALTALSMGLHREASMLNDGDLILVAAVGGGYSAGAFVLEWRS